MTANECEVMAMQTPKSILLHLDNSAAAPARVALARELAEEWNAEVTGVFAVTPYMLRLPMPIEGAAAALNVIEQTDREARESARKMFAAASAGSPLLEWSDADLDPIADFKRRALYCDLMVLGQHNGDDPLASEVPPNFLSDLLIGSGKPGLIVPYAGSYSTPARNVLVAWKATRESARALAASLPWLHHARRVHVATLGGEKDALARDLLPYLVAQGITATVHAEVENEVPFGERILSLAADLGADMLVMGCYGHSRAREWVLGGATRSILSTMTVPVLMAH